MGIAIACPSVILYIPLLRSCEYQRIIGFSGGIITGHSSCYILFRIAYTYKSGKGYTAFYFCSCILKSISQIFYVALFQFSNIL